MMEFTEGVPVFGANFLVISTMRLLFSGVFRGSIASRLPEPLLKRILSPDGMKPERVRKLHENLWYSVWHTISFFLVTQQIFGESWCQPMLESWDFRWTLYGYPHTMPESAKAVYLLELGFWVSCLLFMAVESLRKDFIELMVHHIATITLISLSYVYGYYRIGLLVMAVHDVADIFLYSAKICHYLDLKLSTNVLFVKFVIVFFISRLLVFPFVIRVSWGPFAGDFPEFDYREYGGSLILPSMLSVLQGLHCMWFYLILKMLWKMLNAETKQVEGDIRSDDEDVQVIEHKNK